MLIIPNRYWKTYSRILSAPGIT